MKEKEIIESIKMLAQGQGFYGRLLSQLLDMKENERKLYDRTIATLEKENFTDVVDLVMYLEG